MVKFKYVSGPLFEDKPTEWVFKEFSKFGQVADVVVKPTCSIIEFKDK